MTVPELKQVCRQLGISDASKNKDDLRNSITAAKSEEHVRGGNLPGAQFADSGEGLDEEVVWATRLGFGVANEGAQPPAPAPAIAGA